MKLASKDILTDSIVDGEGLRAVIWTQGCKHHCKGCQNPQTWDFEGGGLVPIDAVLEAIDELEYQTGLTFSGGDPMYQIDAVLEICKYAKKLGLNIWCYTGFTWEELKELSNKNYKYNEVLKYLDVLVDGKFINELKDLNLLFRGSSNQRLIDVPKTLKENKIILIPESDGILENFQNKDTMFI